MHIGMTRSRGLASAALIKAWDNLAPNLLTWSEDMSKGQWTATTCAVTATKITEDATASAQHRADQAYTFTAATAYTLQVQASAAGRTWLRIRLGSNNGAYFDIQNGVVGTTATILSASIRATDNGRFNIVLTATPDANFVRIGLANGDNSSVYSGDNASGANIHRVQLTKGSLATRYVKTTASLT